MAPLSFLSGEIKSAQEITLPKNTTNPALAILSSGAKILDPSLITTDFDLLRFEAAAYDQLDISKDKNDKYARTNNSLDDPLLSTLLISSPYNNPGHYLDLKDLSTQELLLSKALTIIKPLRPDYATAPYTEALNLSTVVDLVRKFAIDEHFEWKEQAFYIVIFRSKLKEVVDSELLYTLDYESHREACESGGLLKYWFGRPDGERRNLATCFWRTREDARLGGLGPWHKKARAAGHELYESIVFSTHRFTIIDGATDFNFEVWK